MCVFCYFSVSCYCMGDIMIDKVWGGKSGSMLGMETTQTAIWMMYAALIGALRD